MKEAYAFLAVMHETGVCISNCWNLH